MYKESTKKKSKQDRKKLLFQFLIIFLLSHIARTLVQDSPTQEITQVTKELSINHTIIKLEVDSIVPEDQEKANLINQKSLQEIESVQIVLREKTPDGALLVTLEIPKDKSSWIINKPNNWKLIPLRKVITSERKNYEISF
ncbi:MAG: hypothetical protein CES88_08015 [Halobacteriovorax sp. JY17]|nr:MAG: hypothetical protein CES88_08015 [Halobacteriovorax sp. JY17]